MIALYIAACISVPVGISTRDTGLIVKRFDICRTATAVDRPVISTSLLLNSVVRGIPCVFLVRCDWTGLLFEPHRYDRQTAPEPTLIFLSTLSSCTHLALNSSSTLTLFQPALINASRDQAVNFIYLAGQMIVHPR